MGRIDGNQPVQLNSLDELFSIKGSDKKLPHDDKLKKGLLKSYGEDNEITYLLTHIKKDSVVSVVRDQHGHLSWSIKGKPIDLGSSWWDRLVHNLKMTFSSKYKKNLEAKLDPKIAKVMDAYTKCWEKELDTHEDGIESAANALQQQKLAQEQQLSDAAKVVEQQRLAQEQLAADAERQAEEVRLAKEAKEQRIGDLTNQIDTGNGELQKLRDELVKVNSLLDKQIAKNEELEGSKNIYLPKAEYETHLAGLADVVKTYNGITFYINEAEEKIIKDAEVLLKAPLRTEEERKAKKLDLTKKIAAVDKIDFEISTRNEMINDYNTIVATVTSQISDKETSINQLRDDLNAELVVVPVAMPVVIPVAIPDPVLTPDEIAKKKHDEAVVKAKAKGLNDDEAEFYVGLAPSDQVHYDWIRKPSDKATQCSTIADFLLTLIKGRGAIRVRSAVTLKQPGVVNIRLGGEDAKITLPSKIEMTYADDKQAWTLNGKGLMMNIAGYDVSLDGSRFEIRDHDFNIKVKSSAQTWGVRIALGLAYPKGIEVPFDVVQQDVFHSNNKVV